MRIALAAASLAAAWTDVQARLALCLARAAAERTATGAADNIGIVTGAAVEGGDAEADIVPFIYSNETTLYAAKSWDSVSTGGETLAIDIKTLRAVWSKTNLSPLFPLSAQSIIFQCW